MSIKQNLFVGIAVCVGLSQGLLKAAQEKETIPESRINEIAGWLPAKPKGFGPPVSDRAAWEKFAKTHAGSSLISKAASLVEKPIPVVTDDLFLDYSRTGNRDHCQAVLAARGDRLTSLALAECLENKGRFIAPLSATIESFCQEKTWVYPAHDGKLNNFYGRGLELDLRSTAVAWDLALVDYLLAEKLPAPTRKLLRENVERRVLQPFRDAVEGRRNLLYWMHATHNWNAVCLAGVACAALALEDSPRDRALYVAASEHYIRYFLKSFTPDGYCSEGMGYWNYGFGHFLMMGEAIRQATGGHLDMLADPEAQAPALFPLKDEIINGMYPTISDCSPGIRPAGQFVQFISERFGLPSASDGEKRNFKFDRDPASTLMFAFPDEPLPRIPHGQIAPTSPLRSWFTNGGVLICRAPDKQFAAVLKGGHNAENHNHNDVGSFSVVLGHTMLICDPGAEVYTKRTFGPNRYDSKVLNSFGHAVPVIAGKLQRTGASAKAVVLRTEFADQKDVLALDIQSAYDVPELKKLQREFEFQRAAPALTVRDNVQFSEPKPLETALITWSDWKRISDDTLQIGEGADSIRVKINTGGLPFDIHSEVLNEDVHTPKKPLRLGISLKEPVKAATVVLVIEPVGANQ